MLRPVALILTLVLPATAALAQEADDGQTKREVKYAERTEIDFTGIELEGEIVRPSHTLVIDRVESGFPSLVALRTDFNDEMRASVNDIK